MNCPPEIADIILEILREGLLRVRAASWASDLRRCELEADHLHNLPDLLINYSSERLRFYWEVERASLIQQSSRPGLDDCGFQSSWERLRPYVESLPQPALAE